MQQETKLLNKNFLLFVAGWEFSMTADALLRFTLPLYIFMATGSATLMGVILTWTAIPVIIIMPIGGIMADRISKRKLMVTLNLLIAGMTLIYTLLIGLISGILLTTILILVLFTLHALITPSAEASVPLLVPTNSLVKANSIAFLLTIFSSVGAPILAGFMLEHIGLVSILWLSISLFILASATKSFANIRFQKSEGLSSIYKVAKDDIKNGIHFIRITNPNIGKIIILTAIASMLAAPVMSVALSVLVTGYFARTESVVGLAQGLVVFGGTFGLILIGILSKKASIKITRPIFLILACLLLMSGVALLMLSSEISFLVILFFFFLITSSMTVLAIIAWAYLGEQTPEDKLGKVMSLNGAVIALGLAIGNGIYGVLLDIFLESPEFAFFILGSLAFIVSYFTKLKHSYETDSMN
ncbi:MAG: MFS transporter [Defluviitaleaceae bacterium]|nr:MFS transporter [Defluviitaleaceae bacterium]